jgi:hypothetical protein
MEALEGAKNYLLTIKSKHPVRKTITFQGPLPFKIELEPSKLPLDVPKRQSGIVGIKWHMGKYWRVRCTINDVLAEKCFAPGDKSDESVIEALEEAKNYLLNVLLPQKVHWQLLKEPHKK